MKTIHKSGHLYKKYKKTQKQKYIFYVFFYSPLWKIQDFNKFNRDLNLNFINVLNIPSAFVIVRDLKTQGPSIKIIYSSSFKLKNIPCIFKKVYNLSLISFKLKNHWYSFDLLLNLKSYKNGLILSTNFNDNIKENIFKLSEFIINIDPDKKPIKYK